MTFWMRLFVKHNYGNTIWCGIGEFLNIFIVYIFKSILTNLTIHQKIFNPYCKFGLRRFPDTAKLDIYRRIYTFFIVFCKFSLLLPVTDAFRMLMYKISLYYMWKNYSIPYGSLRSHFTFFYFFCVFGIKNEL